MSESRPDDCSHCKKPTHVHISKVIGGKVTKLGFCKDCPYSKPYTESCGYDIIDSTEAEKKALSIDSATGSGTACPSCGLRPEDFKEYGRLGCPTCYEVYAEKLEPLYAKLHNGAEHLGKTPKGQQRSISPEQLEALKRRMEEHVNREEYELAAVVRDQIRSLEK